MMAHQTKEPMDIRELSPDVPEGLVAVVKKLMGKKPEDRYTGCEELVEALEPFLGDLSAMPGGVPTAATAAGSGRVPASSASRGGPRGYSSGRMAGLPSKPAGSVPGMKPVGGSNAGTRANPAA